MKKRIRIQGLLMFLVLVVSILFSPFLIPSSKSAKNELCSDVLGFDLILLGFFLRILARGYKSETSLQGKALSKDGIYRLVRNPMYLGTFIIGLGITTALFTWWVFIIFAAVFFIIYLPQIHKEENYLRRNFGQEYEDYCQAAPRFLPSIRAIIHADKAGAFIFKWAWVSKEFNSLIAVFSLALLIEALVDVRLFGIRQFAKGLPVLILSVGFLGLILSSYGKKDISGKN